MQNSNFLKIVIIYTLIFTGVLFWSVRDKEKSVYDNHIVTLKGVEIGVNDLSNAPNFYSQVLGFEQKSSTDKLIEFILPDKRTVTLVKFGDAATESNPITIQIQVRNGLTRLHERFIESNVKTYGDRVSLNISEIEKKKNRKEFSLTSPDNIKFVFYHKNLF